MWYACMAICDIHAWLSVVHDKLHETCKFHAMRKCGPHKHVPCCHVCKNKVIIERYCKCCTQGKIRSQWLDREYTCMLLNNIRVLVISIHITSLQFHLKPTEVQPSNYLIEIFVVFIAFCVLAELFCLHRFSYGWQSCQSKTKPPGRRQLQAEPN